MTRFFSHLSPAGQPRMVDVSSKRITQRQATAEAWVVLGKQLAERLAHSGDVGKGNVLETARIAGILAAKNTALLVPMCHPLSLEAIELTAQLSEDRVRLVSCVKARDKTGVEMEALTAVAVAALTVYDMVKAAGKGVEISSIRLLEKRGGKSGTWKRQEEQHGHGRVTLRRQRKGQAQDAG